MAVVVETTLGDITIDLFIEERPTTCMNFLKLCKIKYYNFCLFHSVQQNFIAQTGDPSGSGRGGSSIFHHTHGNTSNFYEAEKLPKIKHSNIGSVSMVNCGNQMLGSQFFITLGKDLQSLDGEHCVFGEVTEGHEILRKFNEVICDQGHRPYQDIRITHTVVLEDPFDDPPGLKLPDSSPELTKEVLANSRIAPDEEIDETAGLTAEEVEEMQRKREAQAQATILEIVGDLPDADIAPPENVLFVCKLNPVTTDDDLEIIFSRFGKIVSCEVIRDKNTGDSLQYAFVEFDNRKACEDAYFKMDNVLIDDRRIHVDFSQSVSKLRWKGKGRLEHLDDGKSRPDYANYDRISDVKVRLSPDSSKQRGGENNSRTNNRISNRRENDRSSKVSRENNFWRHDGRHERSNERHSRIYSESGRERYRPRESHERYRSEVNRESNYRNEHKYYERERYRNERRKDMYYREDKYQKKSKSESSDSEGMVSTNPDSQNKGIYRKMQNEIHNVKLNYGEKKDVKEKYDDSGDKVEVRKLHRDKRSIRKSSTSSETEDESGSSTDQEMERGRSISKIRQRELSCEEIKTRDKKLKRQSSEKNLAQHGAMKKDKRKRKDSGSEGEKHLNVEDRIDERKVRPDDHENRGGKIEKEEKLNKMKSTSNSGYEKVQKQDKYKHRREVVVGSGSEVPKDASRCQEKKRNRRKSSDSNESIHKSPRTRDPGKKDKKRDRNNSTSTDHRSSSSKHKSDTRDDSESDEQTLVKKSNVVRNKYDSPRHLRRNIIKEKNKKKKQLKKREIVKKKKKRRDKRNKSSSSSRSSDSGSETISSSSTSSSSSSSTSSSGSESSDSSSSPSSSTSSSSSDDNQRRKRRKKVSKVNVKKPKRGTIPKKTRKEHRKLTDVSEEDSRKVKGKVQKKKSETGGKNNVEKHVKVKSCSKRKRMTHSSDSSSESDSSEDSIRDSKRRKRIRK